MGKSENAAREDPMDSASLVLVDLFDHDLGSIDKAAAHAAPRLHRAFSVMLVDDTADAPRVLLQRRALGKYHSGGLWANTCCSHPRRGESVIEAAAKRLDMEMGVCCGLREIGSFVYLYRFAPDLFEYEFDHVLIGFYHGSCDPDPDEASEAAWVLVDDLKQSLIERPQDYAPWLPMVTSLVARELETR